jgi:hypothetical protein
MDIDDDVTHIGVEERGLPAPFYRGKVAGIGRPDTSPAEEAGAEGQAMEGKRGRLASNRWLGEKMLLVSPPALTENRGKKPGRLRKITLRYSAGQVRPRDHPSGSRSGR